MVFTLPEASGPELEAPKSPFTENEARENGHSELQGMSASRQSPGEGNPLVDMQRCQFLLHMPEAMLDGVQSSKCDGNKNLTLFED